MAAPKGNKHALGNKGGGLVKIDDWMAIAQEVLSNDADVLAWTDEDILDEVNFRLEAKGKKQFCIALSTFNRWKNSNTDDIRAIEFRKLYKRSLRRIRTTLLNTIPIDDKWQRNAWILERKFDDWNLRKIEQVDHTTKGEKMPAFGIAELIRQARNNDNADPETQPDQTD